MYEQINSFLTYTIRKHYVEHGTKVNSYRWTIILLVTVPPYLILMSLLVAVWLVKINFDNFIDEANDFYIAHYMKEDGSDQWNF